LPLLTYPLHSSSSYGLTREEQPLDEDYQHDRPEPTTVKEVEMSSPSDKSQYELPLLTHPLYSSSSYSSTREVKLPVNGHPQHRPQVVKDQGAIYHYFLVENETKNKYSPQENTANNYNNYHELRVQDESQTKDATRSEEDNSDKPAQLSEDQNTPLPAPRFYFNARVFVKGKH
jgi:hypothetical protein